MINVAWDAISNGGSEHDTLNEMTPAHLIL